MNLINVFNSIKETGGATYNMNTSELNPKTGYIVSLIGYEKIVDKIPQTFNEFQDIVLNYLQKKVWDILANSEMIYLGFWVHNNKLVIDLSERFETRQGALLTAYERNQQGVWDAAQSKTIYLTKKVSADSDLSPAYNH